LLAHGNLPAESSATVAERVVQARDRQAWRLRDTPWSTNAEMPGGYVRQHLPVPGGIDLLDSAVAAGTLSARGMDKVIKLAWTLADLAGFDRPGGDQVAAALGLRMGEETAV
jgi:magnesium chelatase family protein